MAARDIYIYIIYCRKRTHLSPEHVHKWAMIYVYVIINRSFSDLRGQSSSLTMKSNRAPSRYVNAISVVGTSIIAAAIRNDCAVNRIAVGARSLVFRFSDRRSENARLVRMRDRVRSRSRSFTRSNSYCLTRSSGSTRCDAYRRSRVNSSMMRAACASLRQFADFPEVIGSVETL